MSLEFREMVELRILTGQIVGYRVLSSYNRIAFIGMKNILCTAIASSMEAGYLSGTAGECRYFEIDNLESLGDKIEDYQPNLIVVFVGGSKDFESLRDTLYSLFSIFAKKEIDADFLFHLYTYVKVGLDILRNDDNIRNYLADKRLMTYTANFDEGLIEIREVYLLKNEIYSEIVEEYPISFRHTRIFNEGLKNRLIKFEEE